MSALENRFSFVNFTSQMRDKETSFNFNTLSFLCVAASEQRTYWDAYFHYCPSAVVGEYLWVCCASLFELSLNFSLQSFIHVSTAAYGQEN